MNIEEFVKNNQHLVKVSVSEEFPELRVLKYSRKVFYDDLWTPELEVMRGLVVDADYNIISRPFRKIYNYGIESRAPVFDDNEPLFCMRKVNGFMAAITYDLDYGLVISTTGSLDSDYVQMIKQSLARYNQNLYIKAFKLDSNCTHLFECVHPDDPHIVKEVPGLYYLGSMEKNLENHVPVFCDRVQNCFNSVETFHLTTREVKELTKTVKHEGFVIYGRNGLCSKIKSPWYLVNKLYARKNFVDDLVHKKAKELLDEEYYPLVDYIKSNSRDFNELNEQDRLKFISGFYGG